MTMTTSTERVSTLRKMMCMLSCRPSATPNGNPEYNLQQALECLGETLHADVTGIYWDQPGQTLHQILPESFDLNPQLEEKITDLRANSKVIEFTDDHYLFAAPMHIKGSTNGRLWALFPPEKTLLMEEKELLILAANQLAMVLENFRLYEDMQRLATRRAELLRRVIAQQDERCRQISRELHDEISQSLAALALDIEASEIKSVTQKINPTDKFADFRQRTTGIIKEVNRITYNLRPTLLEELGLHSALVQFTQQRVPANITVHIDNDGRKFRLPEYIEITLFRIGQEAINNIVKHAQAKNIWIELRFRNNIAELLVKDDGMGFVEKDFSEPLDHRIGLGLFGMKERAALVGGQLVIESQPKQGTQILVTVPVANEVTS